MRDFYFHPLAISFVGFSGLGKTTLISKLLEILTRKHRIAYIKHDVHRFEMDKEGKDTYSAWKSGAHQVFISDNTHYAWLRQGVPNQTLEDSLLLDSDFVFVEGHKNFPLPKIVFLDEEEKILDLIEQRESVSTVLAYIGKERSCSNHRLQPYFCRDSIEEITNCILSYYEHKLAMIPLYGLILSGGHSRRMGTDKALLNYDGRLQLERCQSLLQGVCQKTFVSTREGQFEDHIVPSLNRIYDRFVDFGPLGGILTAMQTHTKSAWLVIACDLPFLDDDLLKDLFQKRNPFAMASVFSHGNGFLEPLCGIYEPKMRKKLFAYMANEIYCPQNILNQINVERITLKNPQALTNVNAVQDYELAHSFFNSKHKICENGQKGLGS
jgi:molybdopterin-guanine dinucleotide biosynthesis protein MobB